MFIFFTFCQPQNKNEIKECCFDNSKCDNVCFNVIYNLVLAFKMIEREINFFSLKYLYSGLKAEIEVDEVNWHARIMWYSVKIPHSITHTEK